jgi:diguanylate cyclase (GGDEF)-like protein/PAS domain S-box-containing protein
MTQDLPIAHIMQTGLLTCQRDTPLCDAAARMTERRCSAMLVMEQDQVLGIWTEHDSLSVDFGDPQTLQAPIGDVMSQPVRALHSSTPIGEAALRFGSDGVRHFLVVDAAGMPCGMLTQTDMALSQGLESYLKLREVGVAMRARPLVLSGQLSLRKAARSMYSGSYDAAVVECGVRDLGILTERDMVRFVAQHPGDVAIGELASRPLLTVGQNDSLIRARDLLIDRQVRHLGVLDEQGGVVGLLGFHDMLVGAEHFYLKDLRQALEQRDQALIQSRKNLQLAERVIESSLEGIIITDARTRIEFVNPAFTQMTGYTLEEAVGRNPTMLSSGRHTTAFYREMWKAVRSCGYWRGEIWNRRKDGELYLQLLTITAIRNDGGEVTNYAALFNDITHIRENEERIRRMAYYDPLTRLPNRRLLEDRLALAIHHARRQNQRLAVIFIDLDHFKQVNDSLGHAVGDELLLCVSRRLHARLRENDTLARLGGDEFIVLLNEVEEIDHVTLVARRLIEAISAPFELRGKTLRVGCSLGIGLYPDDAASPEALIHCADAAMYQAKQEGRNTYRLFRPDTHQQDYDSLWLETALRNTAESGEGLEVHYQPLVERDSGDVRGAEALLRWHHPKLGLISPGDFIPLAERSGLILPLGDRVMHLVAQQLCEWRDEGLAPPPISVNLSARQFWQAEFVEQVQAIYHDYSLQPGQIGFELTESVLLDRHQKAVAILEALRALGCQVAIDDFGTGYSSLSYLQELPVTAIKIDQSFIHGLDEHRGSGAIVAAVTIMARELGLGVVAEGVETDAQLRALSRYPIGLIQGFLTGRPVSAPHFARLYLATATA